MALSSLQERFAHEYVIDFNATQAAIRAGYSKKTACSQGNRLLRNVEIAALIGKLREKQFEHLGATRERVIEELARVAFSDLRRLFDGNGKIKPIHSIEPEAAAALAGVDVTTSKDSDERTTRIKLWPKVSALEQLGKHFDIYADHRQSGSGEIHIHLTERDMRL
uniref:Phage terminase small subunit n=1 Tax=Candidatus Kentrum sp. DK TaxID=2126562 RepID=A0A450TB32_9GAMM|nr:MAG: phage terminase small subunit [Candidatus Kentron sp. DK]